MDTFDVIILGAGAAGLMCAATASRRGRNVLVLERAAAPGEKIRISGGGRANFTNLHASPADYLSDNPRFCVSALARYTPRDFIDLVEKHAIAYHQRDRGQLFCDGPAAQITDMLLDEAAAARLVTGAAITRVRRDGGAFTVETSKGTFGAPALVVATGGPSIPKMGASGFAYDLARQFGLRVVDPRPGLVPLTFDAETLSRLDGLSGVSLDAVTAACGKARFTAGLLFTHRGLSGPAILQISSYWRAGEPITLDLLPGVDVGAELLAAKAAHPKRAAFSVLAEFLPRRLAKKFVDWAACDGALGETGDKALRRLGALVNAWTLTPSGTEGLRTAEVTVGGVDTRDLSSKTLESRGVPGLYFIGEAVDVTGHLGGYNFQWAWASGHACGAAV